MESHTTRYTAASIRSAASIAARAPGLSFTVKGLTDAVVFPGNRWPGTDSLVRVAAGEGNSRAVPV
jgi:hypothetical protein